MSITPNPYFSRKKNPPTPSLPILFLAYPPEKTSYIQFTSYFPFAFYSYLISLLAFTSRVNHNREKSLDAKI